MNLKALPKVKPPQLVRYDAMCEAIEQCHSIDEAKEIRNKAIALAAYVKEALNRENERKCRQIRIRAERKTGQLLRETAESGERDTGKGGDRKSPSRQSRVKLADHGISFDQSADWQKLAAIPKKRFEEELQKPGIPSTPQILANVYSEPKFVSPIKDVDPVAIDVWGALMDFERYKWLEREPHELASTITLSMREDLQRLCPKVLAWLKKLETEVVKIGSSA